MKALVIYESQSAATTQVAQAIAAVLQEQGPVELLRVDDLDTAELSEIDLLVIGGPTQHRGMPPGIAGLLDEMLPGTLRGVPALVVDTRIHLPRWMSGSAASAIATRSNRTALFPLGEGELRHLRNCADRVGFLSLHWKFLRKPGGSSKPFLRMPNYYRDEGEHG